MIRIVVSIDNVPLAHKWLGDQYGWTNGREYHAIRSVGSRAAFWIRDEQIALLFKLTWG